MKKVINFIKKYKIHILSISLFFLFARSCSKGVEIKKITKKNTEFISEIDSLTNVVNNLEHKIDSFPEIMRKEKINIHIDYDNYISKQDRGKQLMDLHMVVKENIKELQIK